MFIPMTHCSEFSDTFFPHQHAEGDILTIIGRLDERYIYLKGQPHPLSQPETFCDTNTDTQSVLVANLVVSSILSFAVVNTLCTATLRSWVHFQARVKLYG